MEDQSVDISTLDRKEILAKLDLKPSSSLNTTDLRNKLRNVLQRNNPIHRYISQLNKEDLENLFLLIFGRSGLSRFDRIRKSMANEMFIKFPRAPLTTLTWIERNKKVPTDIEFGIILNEVSYNTNVNKPPKECVDKTTTTDLNRSLYNEKSPEGEMNISNKKCRKSHSKKFQLCSKKV